MVKITYKGKSRDVPATYLKGLKGKEREAQIKSIFEGKDRPKTSAPKKRSGWVELQHHNRTSHDPQSE